MTDQNTPLKTKAKTLEDWYDDYEKLPNGLSDKKYIKELTKKLVLLSDAEPLELEIQRLKKRIEILLVSSNISKELSQRLDAEQHKNFVLEKQIETAKKEKTEPNKPENCSCNLCNDGYS